MGNIKSGRSLVGSDTPWIGRSIHQLSYLVKSFLNWRECASLKTYGQYQIRSIAGRI